MTPRSSVPVEGSTAAAVDDATATAATDHAADDDAAAGSGWVILGWIAFVVLTLGTSLLGRTVFVATDLLQQYVPWDPGTDYTVDNFLSRDVVDSLLPGYAQISQRFAGGDLPGWSSLSGSGTPLASTPSYPTLVPTVWPYLVLPLSLAPVFVKVAQLVVGALGMVLLLRRWGTGRAAGLLAGMIYATSGFFVSWANFPQASVAAFIPLLFWSVERFLQLVLPAEHPAGPVRPWWVRWCSGGPPIALVVACLLFAGFPAVTGWSLYAVGAYTAVRVLARPGLRRAWLAGVGALAGSAFWVLLGMALSAVQLLPFAEQLFRTNLDYREGDFTLTLPETSVITSVLPRVMASTQGPLFAPPVNAIEFNAHLGSAAVLFVVFALLLRRPTTMPRGAFTYLLVTSLVCAMLIWFQNPLVSWFGALPVFDGNPIGRLRSVLFVLLSALAGLGLDAVLRGQRPRRWVGWAALGVLVVGILGAGAVAYREFGEITGRRTAAVDTAVALGVVVVLGVAVLALRSPGHRRVLLPLTVLAVTAQCVIGTGFYWNNIDRASFYPPRASMDFLAANQDHERTAGTRPTLRPSVPALYGVRTLDAHTFAPRNWAALLDGVAVNGSYFETATVAQLPSGSPEQVGAPGLDRLAVRFVTLAQFEPVIGDLVPGIGIGPSPEAGQVSIPPGGEVETVLEPRELRGLVLNVEQPTTPSPDGARLTMTVRDANGDPIVGGRRFAVGFPAGAMPVPLVEPDVTAPGPWTVTTRWEGVDPLVLTAIGGVPSLDAVVPTPGDDLAVVDTSDGMTIYRRDSALPRFRWASQAQVVTDERERVDAVARGPLPDDTVVLDGGAAPTDGAPATVEVTEDSGDVVGARVDAQGAGYLVVADSMNPDDWTATVDGEPAELVVGDQALAAVAVPAGTHDVRIGYTPAGQRLGLVVSGGALVILLVAAGAAGVAGRRHREAPAVPER